MAQYALSWFSWRKGENQAFFRWFWTVKYSSFNPWSTWMPKNGISLQRRKNHVYGSVLDIARTYSWIRFPLVGLKCFERKVENMGWVRRKFLFPRKEHGVMSCIPQWESRSFILFQVTKTVSVYWHSWHLCCQLSVYVLVLSIEHYTHRMSTIVIIWKKEHDGEVPRRSSK